MSEESAKLGKLPDQIAEPILRLLEGGRGCLREWRKEVSSFELDRFGNEDVPTRLCSSNALQRLRSLTASCRRNLAEVERAEVEGWLLALGLLFAHLRDNNRAKNLQSLLALYEGAGQCAQIVRYLRTGKILAHSPIAAVDWFVELVTLPSEEGRKGFLVTS